ncbi:MAG: acetaldehyde dehydrogenase (acetylating) [bacterium]
MTLPTSKLKVAILGSGNIGTDLLVKSLRSPYLECTLFIGRNFNSPGIVKASGLGIRISDRSIDAIINEPECCDLVFDCTSAADAKRHWLILKELGKTVVDLTPAKIGKMCVPAVNLQECLRSQNVNMITCGGQASIPLAHQIGSIHPNAEYIEVVSSIASRSAGPATRLNIDEYVETTEGAVQSFSGCKKAKAILILNPATPCIDMQTTIFAKIANPDMDKLTLSVMDMVAKVQKYVPGYQLILPPTREGGRVVIMVKVQGRGDYLPMFAGNLDIINCAAIAAAEAFAKARQSKT